MKQITGNSGMVREVNRERIAEALRYAGQANIATIAKATGLSIATCSNVITELVHSGEVEELHAESRGGRPARLYAYNVNNALAVSLLLRTSRQGPELRYSVRNRNGESIADGTEKFTTVTIEAIGKSIRSLTRKHPALKAAAVSIPGVIHNGEIEFCDIPELTGINIEKRLAHTSGLNVIAENDMNFAAIGYYTAHRQDIRSVLAYVASPPGEWPGMGLIVNGALVKGKSNFAGEISFLPLECLNRRKRKSRSGRTKSYVPESLAANMAEIVASVAAVINPDIVVIAGSGVDIQTFSAIRKQCLAWIPEQHLPEIILKDDFDDDSLSGMTATAFNTLAPSINLVEKGRLQFDQGSHVHTL